MVFSIVMFGVALLSPICGVLLVVYAFRSVATDG